jgi:hypothetical protein
MSASVLEMQIGQMVTGYRRLLMTSFSKTHSASSESPVMSISFHNGMILTRTEGITKSHIALILKWLVGITRDSFDTAGRIR